MLGIRWQQSLVIDQPSLLFDPLLPAIGAGVRQDDRSPFAGQWRLR